MTRAREMIVNIYFFGSIIALTKKFLTCVFSRVGLATAVQSELIVANVSKFTTARAGILTLKNILL